MNGIHNRCGVVSSTLVVVIMFTTPVCDHGVRLSTLS
jgi:hypothetical protein